MKLGEALTQEQLVCLMDDRWPLSRGASFAPKRSQDFKLVANTTFDSLKYGSPNQTNLCSFLSLLLSINAIYY